MASIRRLKKDVDYLTYAVIADSLNYSVLVGKKDDDKVSEIIAEVITLRNEMRNRISQGRRIENKNEVKKYYREIFSETLKGIDGAFTKLSETVAANK